MEIDNFWKDNNSIDCYFSKIKISTDDVHYAYNYPGEKELNLLGLVKNKKVIEVGCGRGENSIALTKMGAIVWGIDMSEEMLIHAREKSRKNGTEIGFHRMLAEEVGQLNGSFDIAVSAYVLDYINDAKQVFKGVSKILNLEGVFVFSYCHPDQQPDCAIPTGNGTFYIRGIWPGTKKIIENYFHPIETIKQNLEEFGLCIDNIIEANTPLNITQEQMRTYPYKAPLSKDYEKFNGKPHTIIFKVIKT